MKQTDTQNTDYLQGNVMLPEMTVEKLANGWTKASCSGFEVNHVDQQTAVLRLQDQLQEALLNGELRPDM